MIGNMDRKSAVRLSLLALAGAAVVIVAACGDDDEPPPPPPPPPASDAGPRGLEQAGQACTAATQCYLDKTDGGTDAGDAEAGAQLAIRGTITCLDKVPNGYCTHECKDDSDCCAVPGECRTGVKQVCSPFTNESTIKYCFLSCEDVDINRAIVANADAGYYDGGALDAGTREDEYCKSYASIYATCRSSGGGNQNRKVCIPQQ
jgi:hypothetical protein